MTRVGQVEGTEEWGSAENENRTEQNYRIWHAEGEFVEKDKRSKLMLGVQQTDKRGSGRTVGLGKVQVEAANESEQNSNNVFHKSASEQQQLERKVERNVLLGEQSEMVRNSKHCETRSGARQLQGSGIRRARVSESEGHAEGTGARKLSQADLGSSGKDSRPEKRSESTSGVQTEKIEEGSDKEAEGTRKARKNGLRKSSTGAPKRVKRTDATPAAAGHHVNVQERNS